MNCEDYQRNFSKLMDNELGEEECAHLFTHMGTCPACREFFRTSMQIQSTLDELRVPEPGNLGRYELTRAGSTAKKYPQSTLLRRLQEAKISLSFATAALIVVMAGTFAASSLWMRPTQVNAPPVERIVYSYLLPPVDIKAPPVQPKNHVN